MPGSATNLIQNMKAVRLADTELVKVCVRTH